MNKERHPFWDQYPFNGARTNKEAPQVTCVVTGLDAHGNEVTQTMLIGGIPPEAEKED